MINTARTLLLNKSSASRGSDGLFFVSSAFRPVTLTGTLGKLSAALYPSSLSVSGADCCTQAYLQLLNCPELSVYLQAFGTTSYSISDEVRKGCQSNAVTYTDTLEPDSDVAFAYAVDYTRKPVASAFYGLHRWDIHSKDYQNVDVTYSRTGLTSTVRLLTAPAAETNALAVLDGFLGFYYLTPSLSLTGTFTTQADVWIQPTPAFIQARLAAAQRVLETSGNSNALFKSPSSSTSAVFSDFRNLYYQQSEFHLRFGGILLAYLYQAYQRWLDEGSNG